MPNVTTPTAAQLRRLKLEVSCAKDYFDEIIGTLQKLVCITPKANDLLLALHAFEPYRQLSESGDSVDNGSFILDEIETELASMVEHAEDCEHREAVFVMPALRPVLKAVR